MRFELLFSRPTIAVTCAIVGAASYAMLVVLGVLSEALVMPNGGVLGGDHTALWTASRMAARGELAAAYDPVAFEAALHAETGAGIERFGLTWQYPPHAVLLLAPLAALPYLWSYASWCVLTIGACLWVLRGQAGASWFTLGLLALSPVLYQITVTGQAGAGLAALFFAAVLLPDRRPLVAGVCAGLLTVKPQLGVLIPFAYAAGGHRRAFAAAVATAGALTALSVAAYGLAPWGLFLSALVGVGQGVADQVYPLGKMVTVFAALRSGGLPTSAAGAVQLAAAGTAVWLTARLWRSGADVHAKAAWTACAAFWCTPYAYHYDATLLILPYLWVASRLRPNERAEDVVPALALCVLWIAPTLVVVTMDLAGAQLGLSMVLGLALLVAREAFPATAAPAVSPAAPRA